MNKKDVLIIIITTILILSMSTVSFFIMKNKYNKLEELEVNDSINSNDSIDNDLNNKDNNISDDEYEFSEEDVIKYFEKNYDEVENNAWDNVRNKAKDYFITIVDFIFYNGRIKGYTFDNLSISAKLKIISIALKLDNKIEEYIPGYKETISINSSKIYNNAKERLVTLYLDISSEICKNHEEECDFAKEIFNDIKDNCEISWDFIKNLLSSGTSKLRDWYEVYSGK